MKSAIVQIDAAPYVQWYQQHYSVGIGRKAKEGVVEAELAKQSKHTERKIAKRCVSARAGTVFSFSLFEKYCSTFLRVLGSPSLSTLSPSAI